MPEIVQSNSQIVSQLIQQKLNAVNILLRNNQLAPYNGIDNHTLLSATQSAIQNYLSALTSSSTATEVSTMKRGNINSSALYNNFWTAIEHDLKALYAEANNVGQILVDNNNYVNADIQNMLIQLKEVNSDIQNYEILTMSPLANEQVYIENFTTTSNIDVNSALLADTQCNIDTIGGIVTLNISSSNTVQPSDVANVIIGSNSNGSISGTTQLLDVVDNTSLNGLFQYKLTSNLTNPQLLTLDFTIKLAKPTILNFIRIIPNNFGTQTWPTITAMEVSPDGVAYTDIRSILLGVNDNPTQFILAPAASNFAGEGRYTFLPETVRFIHFTIQQSTPYVDPISGLYTWAIGIRDLELTGNKYSATSQLISTPFNYAAGIEKIGINGIQLPQNSYDTSGNPTSLASVYYDMSVDDGMTWNQISPTYLESNVPTSAPQILNVNNVDSQLSPMAPGNINTTLEATSLRYRLRLARNPVKINNTAILPYFSPTVQIVTLDIFTQSQT